MADMTKRSPIGIVENILVKIDKFLFPSDFVVINMLNKLNETMILGRPFLATIHAEIDVFNKEISLGIRSDRVTFNMDKKIHNFTTSIREIYMINATSNTPSDASSRVEKTNDVHNKNNFCFLYEETGIRGECRIADISIFIMAEGEIDNLTMEQYLALTRGNQELMEDAFFGNKNENSHEHVERVLDIVSLFNNPGVSYDAIMLCVFPITLTRAAKRWTAKQLEEIRNFKQEGDETLYQAWERYNDLLYKCPTHDINNNQKVNIFYNGLGALNRQLLDLQGLIPGMTPIQALTAIQTMAGHSKKWHDGSSSRNIESSSNSEGIAAIVNKLENLGLCFLDFYNDPRIIREQRIAAYKGYRGGDVVQVRMSYLRIVDYGGGHLLCLPRLKREKERPCALIFNQEMV
ncbi:hypothetical protein Tco_0128249 [Tanacetum coccineum]